MSKLLKYIQAARRRAVSGGGGGGGDYVGPLDLVPGAFAAYSQRAMAAAWTSNVITLAKQGTDHNFAPTLNNAVDASAISALLGADPGFLTKWVDQSGNARDVLQADTSHQANWVGNFHGKPSFSPALNVVNGSVNAISASEISWPGGAATIFHVAYLDAGDTDGNAAKLELADAVGNQYFESLTQPGIPYIADLGDAAGNYTEWDGSSNCPTGLTIFETVYKADGTVLLFANGVDQSSTLASGSARATSALTGTITLELAPGLPNESGSNSGFYEAVIWNSELSSGDRLAVRQNMAAYYGITLP